VEAGFFHTDGQTDMKKLLVDFSNFANTLKNQFALAGSQTSSFTKNFDNS
jgi:hypothetical protein